MKAGCHFADQTWNEILGVPFNFAGANNDVTTYICTQPIRSFFHTTVRLYSRELKLKSMLFNNVLT